MYFDTQHSPARISDRRCRVQPLHLSDNKISYLLAVHMTPDSIRPAQLWSARALREERSRAGTGTTQDTCPSGGTEQSTAPCASSSCAFLVGEKYMQKRGRRANCFLQKRGMRGRQRAYEVELAAPDDVTASPSTARWPYVWHVARSSGTQLPCSMLAVYACIA